MDPIYYTDAYSKSGCVISIKVPSKNEKGRCWPVQIQAPKKENHSEPLEIYLANSLQGALKVIECLSSNMPVPKNYHLI